MTHLVCSECIRLQTRASCEMSGKVVLYVQQISYMERKTSVDSIWRIFRICWSVAHIVEMELPEEDKEVVQFAIFQQLWDVFRVYTIGYVLLRSKNIDSKKERKKRTMLENDHIYRPEKLLEFLLWRNIGQRLA